MTMVTVTNKEQMQTLERQNEKRNEIVRTFRKYARLGLVEASLNPIQIYKKIDVLCSSRRTKLDMLAVFDTLRLLTLAGEEETLLAVKSVYFAGKAHRLTKSERGRRVCDLATNQFCDDRTVYRRLRKARELYESVREKEGLILDGTYSERFRFEGKSNL